MIYFVGAYGAVVRYICAWDRRAGYSQRRADTSSDACGQVCRLVCFSCWLLRYGAFQHDSIVGDIGSALLVFISLLWLPLLSHRWRHDSLRVCRGPPAELSVPLHSKEERRHAMVYGGDLPVGFKGLIPSGGPTPS